MGQEDIKGDTLITQVKLQRIANKIIRISQDRFDYRIFIIIVKIFRLILIHQFDIHIIIWRSLTNTYLGVNCVQEQRRQHWPNIISIFARLTVLQSKSATLW